MERIGRNGRTQRTGIFFPLLVMWHRTLIRAGRNGVRQFRLGFSERNLFPSGRPALPADSAVKLSYCMA